MGDTRGFGESNVLYFAQKEPQEDAFIEVLEKRKKTLLNNYLMPRENSISLEALRERIGLDENER